MDAPCLEQFLQHRITNPESRDGVYLDARTNDGMTSLHIAALYGRLKVVQVLLDSGADMNLVNGQGETALKVTRKNGHRAVVQVLADRDALEDVRRNAFGKVTNALSQVFHRS